MARRLKYFLLALSILFFAVSCDFGSKKAETSVQPSIPAMSPTPAPALRIFSYECPKGEKALPYLKTLYKVTVKDFGKDYGEMVTGIENIQSGQNDFWAFYLNNKFAEVGASNYECQNGDLVEWRLEKINK